MTESAYLRSLRAIRPREVDLFQKRRENGHFRAIPPVQEVFERALVAAWQVHQDGLIISIDSICEKDPVLTEIQVAELAESPYFQQALTARGIPFGDTLTHLSGEQLFAIQVMTDPSISTPVMQRLKRLNVSYKKWQGWLRQPVFSATYTRLRQQISNDMVDPILTSLSMKATEDVPAAKLALEIAGVYTPGASTMQAERQLDMVIQRLQEAITLFCDDETLRQIGDFVKTGERPGATVELRPLEPAGR